MTLFLPLLLTHFLADYPLQSGALIKLKKQGYWGVLLHCLIHLGVMAAMLFPLLHSAKVWFGIGIIFITHNLIDQTKVRLDKKNPTWRLALYLIDQLLHLAIVTSVAWYLSDLTTQNGLTSFYSHQSLFLYGLILIWSSYFFDITRYFIKHPKNEAPYQRDYKLIVSNLLIVTVGFGIYWLIG